MESHYLTDIQSACCSVDSTTACPSLVSSSSVRERTPPIASSGHKIAGTLILGDLVLPFPFIPRAMHTFAFCFPRTVRVMMCGGANMHFLNHSNSVWHWPSLHGEGKHFWMLATVLMCWIDCHFCVGWLVSYFGSVVEQNCKLP